MRYVRSHGHGAAGCRADCIDGPGMDSIVVEKALPVYGSLVARKPATAAGMQP